jgi:AcrR family transcriptional regulator
MSPRAGLTKEIVVEAAINIADKENISAVTLSSVAKALQVKSPSLYNHIDGLTGLKKDMAKKGLQDLYETLANGLGESEGEGGIFSLSKAYLDFARKNPGLYEAASMAPKLEDNALNQAAKQIVDLTLKVLAVFNLEKETALHHVRGLRSMLHGFASLESLGGFGMPFSIDESLHETLKTFLRGLAKK